jgi:hypothetical protein
VRFELRQPRLRVESRGEVTWATLSGQCGIRFVDLSPRMTRQINEWIFGNLLEGIPLHSDRAGLMFAPAPVAEGEQADGLIVSAAPLKSIDLSRTPDARRHASADSADTDRLSLADLGWLSQPLSGRRLIWTINALVVVAAVLLFALVFLSVTREPPRWPISMMGGAVVLVAFLYWGFFQVFGGTSPGARLARLAGREFDEGDEDGARFR